MHGNRLISQAIAHDFCWLPGIVETIVATPEGHEWSIGALKTWRGRGAQHG